MIFKDEVPIEIRAGKGGDGAATFRHEKFVEFGGPDGGDGGDGGNIVFKVNPHMRTLSHIHNHQKFKAEDGGKGGPKKCFGRKGHSTIIEVPAGTIVFDANSSVALADLVTAEDEYIAAHGGRGGKGNVHFKSSTNQSPFYAQKGKLGEEKSLMLELKMIAHIGLVGYPNAGKSTLVSRITNARPKIGNYPFTTLQPNIGVMTIDDAYTSILIADIPGLIEGAHNGKGLGIEFLKHIERTKVILYMLDASDTPMDKFKVLQNELRSYSEVLYNRDFIIVLNKMDLIFEEKDKKELIESFQKYSQDVYPISALLGEGLNPLKQELYKKYLEVEQKDREEKATVKINEKYNINVF